MQSQSYLRNKFNAGKHSLSLPMQQPELKFLSTQVPYFVKYYFVLFYNIKMNLIFLNSFICIVLYFNGNEVLGTTIVVSPL